AGCASRGPPIPAGGAWPSATTAKSVPLRRPPSWRPTDDRPGRENADPTRRPTRPTRRQARGGDGWDRGNRAGLRFAARRAWRRSRGRVAPGDLVALRSSRARSREPRLRARVRGRPGRGGRADRHADPECGRARAVETSRHGEWTRAALAGELPRELRAHA